MKPMMMPHEEVAYNIENLIQSNRKLSASEDEINPKPLEREDFQRQLDDFLLSDIDHDPHAMQIRGDNIKMKSSDSSKKLPECRNTAEFPPLTNKELSDLNML